MDHDRGFDPDAAGAELAGLVRRLEGLSPDARPHWGRMGAQQVVEHLESAFLLSLGEVLPEVVTPPQKLSEARAFLRSPLPMPRGVVLPGLEDLPAVRHPDLVAARGVLELALDRFLRDDRRAGAVPRHPVFGELDREGWLRFHLKHVTHHLEQFGLADRDDGPAG